jgi:predicted NBD/HSP70 family sugar kinase
MVPRSVLAVDVGGSHVKILASGERKPRGFESGRELTPEKLVHGVGEHVQGWNWHVVSVGVPTPVLGGALVVDPVNLGAGWVAFDFVGAFGKPTRVVNDAVMQAIGSYDGGRMLFLGLGTGLGSAFIDDGAVEAMELGHMPFRDLTLEDCLGKGAIERFGKDRWQDAVSEAVERLSFALEPDYVVIGGGGADELEELPPRSRRGGNENAFVGGFRLWEPPWARR